MRNIVSCLLLGITTIAIQTTFIAPNNIDDIKLYNIRPETKTVLYTTLFNHSVEIPRFIGDVLVKLIPYLDISFIGFNHEAPLSYFYLEEPVEQEYSLAVSYLCSLASQNLNLPTSYTTGSFSYDLTPYAPIITSTMPGIEQPTTFNISTILLSDIEEEEDKINLFNLVDAQAQRDTQSLMDIEEDTILEIKTDDGIKYIWCHTVIGNTGYILDPTEPNRRLATVNVEDKIFLTKEGEFKVVGIHKKIMS